MCWKFWEIFGYKVFNYSITGWTAMAKKSNLWHSTDWCLTHRKLFWCSSKLDQITEWRNRCIMFYSWLPFNHIAAGELDRKKKESITVRILWFTQDPQALRENTFELLATLIACGLDPSKSTLFLQSSVPQQTELSWILGCLATIPRLSALPQFKEKSGMVKDVNIGLFTYPILQSADILAHK